MNREETNSWIFLAVGMAARESPATLDSITGMADGINHAIPTHKELQNAFGWLLKQELVLKEGRKFQVTRKGRALLDEARAKFDRVFGQWDYLKKQFLVLSPEAKADDVSEEEVSSAYNIYKKRFWRKYKQLLQKEKGDDPKI